VKNQYANATEYPLRDSEPRLLALDSFKPHMNKGRKDNGKKESKKALIKREKEEKLQQELRDLLKKLNVLVSIIPGGCTGYL